MGQDQYEPLDGLHEPAAVVRRMFDAFRRGDVDGILETVHPDSTWVYVGANPRPRRATIRGHDGVRGFFEGILNRLEMQAYEPTEFVVRDDTVVVFGSERGLVRRTGDPFTNEWVQKYVVRNGLIVEMLEFNVVVSGQQDSTRREERIDEALRMTFPASDPPSWPSGRP